MSITAGVARAEVKEALIFNAKRETTQQQGSLSLYQASDGALYGTSKGTASPDNGGYNGSVYKVTPCTDYPYRTLVPFSSSERVLYGLTEGPDGNLFGTQYAVQNTNAQGANGTIFKMTKAGKLEVLHTFDGALGKNPAGPPTVAEDGTLYGVTFYGGITGQNSQGFGAVYKLKSGGELSLVYDFGTDAGRNGGNPQGRLARDKDGNLYGTARTGGENMAGAVFKIAPDGKASVLASFGGGSAGSFPSDLLLSRDGKALYGKLHGGAGSVFTLTLDGKLSTLHAFTKDSDGAFEKWSYNGYFDPAGTLLEGKDGKLYGTAESGGPYNEGTVYRIDPADGTFEVIYAFKGTSDGGTPVALLQGSDGHLYGTALSGGSNSDVGGVFKVALDGNLEAPACPAGTTPSTPTAGAGGSAPPDKPSSAGGASGSSKTQGGSGGSASAGEDKENSAETTGSGGARSTQAGRGGAGGTGTRSSAITAGAPAAGSGASKGSDIPFESKSEKSGCMVSAVGASTQGSAPLVLFALSLGLGWLRRQRRQ